MAKSLPRGSQSWDIEIEIRKRYLMQDETPEQIAIALNLNVAYVEKVLKNVKKPVRSKGEIKLFEILKIIYYPMEVIEQHPFFGFYLDFYVPSLRLAFEYDGQFHFQQSDFVHGSGYRGLYKFEHGVKNDDLKNKLCKENNIYLIRIPFTTKLTEPTVRGIIHEHHDEIINNLASYDPAGRVRGEDI